MSAVASGNARGVVTVYSAEAAFSDNGASFLAVDHLDSVCMVHLDGTVQAARIVVSDDGVGMSPDQVARCFDRFAQPGFTQPGDRALGLGLPLAKQFVEAHGGAISLLSEPGEGTLITVTLPRG